MAQAPRGKHRTRRTLVTLAGAVVAALVVWRLLPNEPPPKPGPDPDKPAS
jgi:hypothetical protein